MRKRTQRFLGFGNSTDLYHYLKLKGFIREMPTNWIQEEWIEINTSTPSNYQKAVDFFNLPVGTIIEMKHKNNERRFHYLVKSNQGWLHANFKGEFVTGGYDKRDINNHLRNFWLSPGDQLFEQVERITSHTPYILVRETKEGLQELIYPGDQLIKVGDIDRPYTESDIFRYASHIKILGNLLKILPTNLLNYPRGGI